MKTLQRFLFVCVFVCCTMSIVATTIQHKVIFDTKMVIDTTIAQDGNIYSTINLPNCIFSSEEGTPQLPIKIVKLIIPADEEPADVICSLGENYVISLNYPVFPVQKPIPTSINFEGNEFVEPNKEVYSLDTDYPGRFAKILRTNHIRGNNVVIIEISPVSYNPKKNQIDFYESIEINLQTKPSQKVYKSPSIKNKEKFDSYLKALVDNKDDVIKYSVINEKGKKSNPANLKSGMSTESISIDCEYVVITTSSLSSYFDDFIEWKKQKGVDIELVTVESIYSNYTGDQISGINDNPGKIRQFLFDAYNNGLEYALLGGTSSIVPIRYGWGSNYLTDPDYEIPADLYYSDFDGDWKVDADLRYGEPTQDDVEYGADIFVGRLLCANGTQVQNWTNKLLLYEQNPGNGNTAYLRKALYTQADQLQSLDQASDIADRFGTIFTTDEIFEEEYNGVPNYNSPESPQFPTGADVISEMTSGYGFVSWFNHGSPTNIAVATKGINDCGGDDRKKVTRIDNYNGWCQYPENGNGLDNLSYSTKPFVLYTLGCEVAPFDTWASTAPQDNLGAQITNQSYKGGPIFLGNTRYGYVYDSWYLQQDFTDILEGGTYRLGVAEADSKGVSGSHYVWLSHNLIGCPETEMWTNTPSSFSNAFAIICGNDVTVNTGGITNSVVCIMSSNDNGASYWNVDESSSSEKTFYNVTKPFVITITKHNFLPKVIQSSEIIEEPSSSISGLSSLCSATFYEIEEVPLGSTITWNQSANITRNSAQGANPCSFSPNGSGSGSIYAQIITTCEDTFNITKTILIETPPHDLYGVWCEGGDAGPVDYSYPLWTAPYYTGDSIGWEVYPAADITDLGQGYANIYFDSPGYYTIWAYTVNGCGEGNYVYTYFTVYEYELLLSPNPAYDEVEITIDYGETDNFQSKNLAEQDYVVTISDMYGITQKQKNYSGKRVTVPIHDLKSGTYLVRLSNDKIDLTEQLVIKR